MNTQIITFQADEQCLVKTGGIDKYASDTVSYIEAQFTLGENWSGYDQISAIWQNRYGTKRSVLDTEGVCLVPWEMLTKRSDLLVNLVGSIADGDVLTDRLTTFAIKALEISQDVPIDADTPTPITPSEYEQFVATVAADADRAEAAKLDARESAAAANDSALLASQSAQSASQSAESAEQSAEEAEQARDGVEEYALVSEGYANGKQNGEPVESDSPYYENNAEYFKDEAWQAVASLDLGLSVVNGAINITYEV